MFYIYTIRRSTERFQCRGNFIVWVSCPQEAEQRLAWLKDDVGLCYPREVQMRGPFNERAEAKQALEEENPVQ